MGKRIVIAQDQDIDESALSTHNLLDLRVLAKNGQIVGKVSDLKVHPISLKLLGITVDGRFDLYIGRSYFDKISSDSIILNVDPTVFLIGKRVITNDGKNLGKVIDVKRKGNRNEVKFLVVSSFLKKKLLVPPSAIRFTNGSILLNKHYNGTSKYFWQKN